MNNVDWKLYSLLGENAENVELYLGKPDHISSFDASTGAAVYYTKEYFYYGKGIIFEFLVHFGKTFRPTPSQTKLKLNKITISSKDKSKPESDSYLSEILKGIYLDTKYTKEEIESFVLEFENKGIKVNIRTNENQELINVTLTAIPEKQFLLNQLKIEQKTILIPQYKLETKWQSQAHTWEVTGLYYLDSKDILVSISSDSNLKLWSFDSSNCQKTFQEPTKWKPGLSYVATTNSENKILVGNKAGEVVLWDLDTLKLGRFVLGKKQDAVSKIILIEDKMILASVLHSYLYAYSIPEKKVLYKIKGDLAFNFFPFAVHRGKKELINGNNQNIYNLEDGKKIGKLPESLGYIYRIIEIDFSSDEKTLCIVTDEKIILVDYESKQLILEEKIRRGIGFDNPVKMKFILNDKQILIAGMGFLKLFDINSRQTIFEVEDFEFGTRSLTFIESKNLILIGSWEGRILGFDSRTGKKVKIWGGHKELVYSVAVYNDKSLFLSGDCDGYIYYWDRETRNLVQFHKIHNSAITSIEILPAGLILTGSWDKKVKLSDLSGQILWEAERAEWIYKLYWVESKQSVLVSTKAGNICLLNLDQTIIYEIQLDYNQSYPSDFDSLAYCNSIGQFAYVHKKSIQIHDIYTGEKLSEFKPPLEITRMSFSPDGGKLFLSDYSGNIHCMNKNTGEIVSILRGHTDRISHFSFYEDWMVTTGREEKVFLWNWKNLEFLATADHSAGGVSPVAILDKSQILCGGKDSNLVLRKIILNEEVV